MASVLTIQDMSCMGKCSLTVALPVLNAAGVEAAVIPTALLSTHTAFKDPYILPLDASILPIASHLKEIGARFDCIYTGYLSGTDQIRTVEKVLDMFQNEGTKLIVDPVMADNGCLYSGFDASYVRAMKEYCSRADYILPNLTEAALLSDSAYNDEITSGEATRMLESLTFLGPTTVMTGVPFGKDRVGIFGQIAETEEFFFHDTDLYPKSFHGTGDIFASVFSAAIALGKGPKAAGSAAVEFTAACINGSQKEEKDYRFGVNLEARLPLLHSLLKEY